MVGGPTVNPDNVALPEPAVAWNSVDNLVIDRSTQRRRISVVSLEGRNRTRFPDPGLRQMVKVASCHSWFDCFCEFLEHCGDYTACSPHFFDLRFGFPDNHQELAPCENIFSISAGDLSALITFAPFRSLPTRC